MRLKEVGPHVATGVRPEYSHCCLEWRDIPSPAPYSPVTIFATPYLFFLS